MLPEIQIAWRQIRKFVKWLELDIVIWQEKLCKNMQFFSLQKLVKSQCALRFHEIFSYDRNTFISIVDLFFSKKKSISGISGNFLSYNGNERDTWYFTIFCLLHLLFPLNSNFLCLFFYRVSHSKVDKVNWLWWGCMFEFFLV